MVEPTIPPAAFDMLNQLLGDDQVFAELVTRIAKTFTERIPEYAAMPMEEVEAGVRHTMFAGFTTTERARLPDQAELADIVQVITERARRGVSLAAILDAYNLGAREFSEMLLDYGRRHGYAEADVLATMQLFRRWMDDVTVAAATAHHKVGVELAREDEARTGAALRALFDQRVPADVAAVHLVQLGLDPAGRYAAVRGRTREDVAASALREAFPAGAVVAVAQRDVVGLVDEPPAVTDELGTFGIGPFRTVEGLYDSAASAGRAYAAAAQLYRTGVHSLEQLRLAAVAATDGEIARIVGERLLAPLRAKGRYGADIWETVVAFLEHGLRVEETAAAMHVHPNTLRHRLGQFTSLTGADLRKPADIAETWWLATINSVDQEDRHR